MLRKLMIAAGLSAATLAVTVPSAASAQYYDSRPRTSFSITIGNGYGGGYYNPGYYNPGYYVPRYGYANRGYGYDRRAWAERRRWEHRRHRDWDRDRGRRWRDR